MKGENIMTKKEFLNEVSKTYEVDIYKNASLWDKIRYFIRYLIWS